MPVLVTTIIIITAFIIVVLFVLLNNLKVVLKSQGNKLVFELIAHIEVLIHEFSNILLFLAFLITVLFFLFRLALRDFLLVWHSDGLEKIEETLLLNNLGNGAAGLVLLGLLLLLDLLLSDILAILPLDLSALALLDHVLSSHHEALSQLCILEVVVLLKCEYQVKAVAWVV